MDTLTRLDELVELLDLDLPLYLRYSPGPEADAAHPSTDHESGLTMPGHSATPLAPPLTGEVADTGPDNEPLLVAIQPIAWLSPDLVVEAHRHYQQRMDAGRSLH